MIIESDMTFILMNNLANSDAPTWMYAIGYALAGIICGYIYIKD